MLVITSAGAYSAVADQGAETGPEPVDRVAEHRAGCGAESRPQITASSTRPERLPLRGPVRHAAQYRSGGVAGA